MVKTVGIATDPYKVKAFKKALSDAGYSYTVHGASSDPLMVIKVEVEESKVLTEFKDLIAKTNRAASN